MDPYKRRSAIEDITTFYECGAKAGIDHALFIGFGLSLGIIRERDFIAHDTDVDMCIRSDLITPEQELKYLRELKKNGMLQSRFKYSLRTVEKGWIEAALVPGGSTRQVRFSWFSVRKKKDRFKFCHWHWFPYNGYMWHGKGGLWLNVRKFNPKEYGWKETDSGLALGLPQSYLQDFQEVKFQGIKIKIPFRIGSCLDTWYPGWLVPRKGGSSAKKIVLIIGNWMDKSTWKILKK